MYYSAWDLQCKEWFSTGLNSECRFLCVRDMWESMIQDWDDKEIEEIPICEVLSYSGVEIVEHKNKINNTDISRELVK